MLRNATYKTLIAIAILFSAANAFSDSLKGHIGLDPYSLGVLTANLTFLVIASWLLKKDFHKNESSLKWVADLKYFVISILIFLTFLGTRLGSLMTPQYYTEVNGMTIPLKKCIDGQKEFFPDFEERKKLCECMAENLSNSDKIKEEFQWELRKGRFDIIADGIKSNKELANEVDLEVCMTNVRTITWTDKLIEASKKSMLQELNNSDLKETNDIEKYCDCIIDEFTKIPFKEVQNDSFANSNAADSIRTICLEKSELKNNTAPL